MAVREVYQAIIDTVKMKGEHTDRQTDRQRQTHTHSLLLTGQGCENQKRMRMVKLITKCRGPETKFLGKKKNMPTISI